MKVYIFKRALKKCIIIILLMVMGVPLYAKLYLPDNLSFCPGYSLGINTFMSDQVLHGFHFNVDYGRSLSPIDETYSFYYYVPLAYQYFPNNIHEFNMGVGFRYNISRTNLVNPYIGYALTFDQLYDGNYYYGIRNKVLAGVNIAKVDKPILFLEGSYHYSRLSGIPDSGMKMAHILNVSAGIRFVIDRCDCPHF
jgi:hypothetical protein